jgi:predicted ferric reductase
MRKSAIFFIGFLAIIFGGWMLADSLYLSPYDAQKFAGSFTQITGLLAIGLMAFSTFLAVRPIWLEPYLGGLDKMYRLHKWMGITGTLIGIVHWLTASGGEGGHGQPSAADAAAQTFWQSLHGPAHGVAQPALWVLLALVAIALIKKIPYHIFALTHRLTPVLFLLLTFHSAALMKADYWTQPIGWLMGTVYAIGAVAAVIALTRVIGTGRKVGAKVVDKLYLPEMKTLRVELEMEPGWKGHKPGQFAFVRGRSRWSAHPFTIASDWNPATRRITFIVKELGDQTMDLNSKLPLGADLIVEGPYGQFNFEHQKPRQIWISGGIGITPFVARMKMLGNGQNTQAIDLFHSDVIENSEAFNLMRADAAAANVKLHLNITPRDGRMTGERIRAAVPDWKNASVWFCGPSAFAAALKLDLARNGLPLGDFHHELFEMR